jgi:hypothetical protein
MPKKDKHDMLIRGVPTELWEKIDKYCRQQGLNRKAFIEQAINHFEGIEKETDKDKEDAKINNIILLNISKYNAYVMKLINIKQDFNYIIKNIKILDDPNLERKYLAELADNHKILNYVVEKMAPKYEIPNNVEGREKLGLPDEYIYEDIPFGYKREGVDIPYRDEASTPMEIKKKLENFNANMKDVIEKTQKIEESEQKIQLIAENKRKQFECNQPHKEPKATVGDEDIDANIKK